MTKSIFICPRCNSPHFHFNQSQNAEDPDTYICSGNVWANIPGCGYQGPSSECCFPLSSDDVEIFYAAHNAIAATPKPIIPLLEDALKRAVKHIRISVRRYSIDEPEWLPHAERVLLMQQVRRKLRNNARRARATKST